MIVLIYNEEQVSQVLAREENGLFLTSYGYDLKVATFCNTLPTLQRRYKCFKTNRQAMIGDIGDERKPSDYQYPHEIGILLGFPIQDVKDFIKYRGTNYIYCGAWKVYHDLEHALEIFDQYRFVRESAIKTILSGKRLQDLRINYTR